MCVCVCVWEKMRVTFAPPPPLDQWDHMRASLVFSAASEPLRINRQNIEFFGFSRVFSIQCNAHYISDAALAHPTNRFFCPLPPSNLTLSAYNINIFIMPTRALQFVRWIRFFRAHASNAFGTQTLVWPFARVTTRLSGSTVHPFKRGVTIRFCRPLYCCLIIDCALDATRCCCWRILFHQWV